MEESDRYEFANAVATLSQKRGMKKKINTPVITDGTPSFPYQAISRKIMAHILPEGTVPCSANFDTLLMGTRPQQALAMESCVELGMSR
jgi:hypothetical protein